MGQATALFKSKFGTEPVVSVFAPGRINLMGEHTDYNDGLVLPMPLPLGIDIVLAQSMGSGLEAISTLDNKLSTREFADAANGDWTDFLLGSIVMSGVKIPNGLRVAVHSNLPAGASVSSSAALQVAMLRGLRDLFNLSIDDDTIARLAQKSENEFVGLNCGLMDQMVCSKGQAGSALFFDTRSGETKQIALSSGVVILTIHSGQSRRLVDNEYNMRRASCERAASDIGVPALRDANIVDLSQVKSEDDRNKARHVIADNIRVIEMMEAMENSAWKQAGKLLFACHKSLSCDFDVSTPAMDALVESARKNGAFGARMTGAGFGGCIIVLTEIETADTITEAIIKDHPNAYLINKMVF
jgi:galactokinase